MSDIEAGRDRTPVPENAWPTAGQLWHQLLEVDEAARLDRLGRLIDGMQQASECFLMNHKALQDECQHLRAQVASIRDETIREFASGLKAALDGTQ